MFWRRQNNIAFEEVALAVLKLRNLKSKRTFLAARFQISRLIRHFGKTPIRSISEQTWADYVIKEAARSPRKFFDDRKHMRTILLYARREGFIEHKVRLPIPDQPSRIGREITAEEREKLLQHADMVLRFQIEIAWKMGLRLREMMGLRWDQFDWDRKTIKLLAGDTKTRRGREIPINLDLIDRFEQMRSASAAPYVFPSPKDPFQPQDSNKTAWNRCKRVSGVFARWHDLRHTCATELLRRGIQPHIVKSFLGMSEAVLLRIYAHASLNDLSIAAKVMSEKR